MKIQVRQGVFETNSSSTHSLSIHKQSDWDRFKNGEMIMENFPWAPKLVEKKGIPEDEILTLDIYNNEKDLYWDEYNYMTYDAYNKVGNYERLTKSTENNIALSIYGSDY